MESARNIIVSHVTRGGMAFAFTLDNGEAVYIPKRVASAANVEEQATYAARVVPNAWQPEKTPLMAVMISRQAPASAPLDEATAVELAKPVGKLANREIAHRVIDILSAGGAWTAAQLIQHTCGEDWEQHYDRSLLSYVSVYLKRCWEEGEISRSEIYQNAEQSNPSRVKWAADWNAL